MTPQHAVKTLVQAGFSEQRIVNELSKEGVVSSQPTINRVKNGTHRRVDFALGSALIALAGRVAPVRGRRTSK